MNKKYINKKEKKSEIKKLDLESKSNKSLKRKIRWIRWPVKIFIVTIFLSLAFSTLSEVVLCNVGIIVSILLILIFLIAGITADMIGLATTACPIGSILEMESKKIKGITISLFLVKNAEKVSSICNDVIGDVCGVISGAAGSAITIKLISSSMTNSIQILIAASVSALIAGLMIFGKALCKKYALDNCTKVVLATGKFFSLLNFKRKK